MLKNVGDHPTHRRGDAARRSPTISTPAEFVVVTGGPEVGARIQRPGPGTICFFTGAATVGSQVGPDRGPHDWFPVTLELGGKNPTVGRSRCRPGADRQADHPAPRLANSGQICLSPDYVFVPREREKPVSSTRRKTAFRGSSSHHRGQRRLLLDRQRPPLPTRHRSSSTTPRAKGASHQRSHPDRRKLFPHPQTRAHPADPVCTASPTTWRS